MLETAILELAAWPMPWLVGTFVLAAAVVLGCGLRVTSLADVLADRTGMGEAIAGVLLLGAATSFSGVIVSVTSASDGHASLAYSNAVGGIAAQTAFLAIADLTYEKANLEHAAAELANVFQAVVLVILLALPLVASSAPQLSVLAVHPVSLIIPAVYVGALFATRSLRDQPMWEPVSTGQTREDEPEDESASTRDKSSLRLALGFVMLVIAMGVAGWVISKTAGEMMGRLPLSESLVGALATAAVTSLPELVTTIAAVRRGALQLAVGGIIGGNTFDTLFVPAADVAYREGSLYHATSMADQFWTVTALLMTSVLVGGLLFRQRHGPGRIGVESVALLLIYAAAIAVQATGGG